MTKFAKRRLWTEDEIEYLRENYPKAEKEELVRVLGRSYVNITNKANVLGFYRKSKTGRQPKRQRYVVVEEPLVFDSELDAVLHEVKIKENYYPIFKK